MPDVHNILNLIFKLRYNKMFLGMQNCFFLMILISDICLGFVACVILFKQPQETNRNGYAFSLFKDGASFFDDDEKEIEVCGRLLNGQMEKDETTKPYFNSDNISTSDE